jgi:hypothetical protein
VKRLGLAAIALGVVAARKRGMDPRGTARRLSRLPDELPGDLAEARAAGERARERAMAEFDEKLNAARAQPRA